MAVLFFQITCLLKITRLKTHNYVTSCYTSRVSRAELTRYGARFEDSLKRAATVKIAN